MKIMKKIVKKIDNNSLIKSIRVIFLFFSFLFFVDSAMSATYTVTTTADSGGGSLRNAIVAANSTFEDDTILFNISDCSACTITLTSGPLVIAPSSSAGRLTIRNANIFFQSIYISGNNSDRVFQVDSGANLTIDSITIRDGSASSSGGGIDNNGGTVNARNTIIANNSAPNGPDFGGTLNSQGYNLIKDTSGTTITGVTTGNITGQDPLLTPLGYYGGSTRTRALYI
jgi:hypothetical protein